MVRPLATPMRTVLLGTVSLEAASHRGRYLTVEGQQVPVDTQEDREKETGGWDGPVEEA